MYLVFLDERPMGSDSAEWASAAELLNAVVECLVHQAKPLLGTSLDATVRTRWTSGRTGC